MTPRETPGEVLIDLVPETWRAGTAYSVGATHRLRYEVEPGIWTLAGSS